MIDPLQFAIHPHVQVDDGDALQFVELTKVRQALPFFGRHALDDVDGHGADVLVGHHLLSRAHEQMPHGPVVVGDDLLDRRGHDDLAPPGLDVLYRRGAETIGLIPVEEGHLQAVALVEEAIHGGQDHGHAELVRVDKIECLGHGDEDLLVDALGHAVFAHKVGHAEFVLRVDEGLALDEHGEEGGRRLYLFPQRQHLLIHQDGQAEVERRGYARYEVEGGELPGELLHREYHLVDLPLQPVVYVQFGEQIHHVRVRPEEDVQAGLDPIPVLVLPRRHLSPQHVPRLVDGGFVPGVGQIFGARQSGQPSPDDGDLLPLAVVLDLERAVERRRHGLGEAIIVGILEVRLGEILHRQIASGGRHGGAAGGRSGCRSGSGRAAGYERRRKGGRGRRRRRQHRREGEEGRAHDGSTWRNCTKIYICMDSYTHTGCHGRYIIYVYTSERERERERL
mmetsp:Transcript_21608/g.63425  ORF Transcript_21608/g.63425 Transcript_21608/m.63425 type:complete len:451 (-) Transcript_21608:32-1384(-)